jgi:fatty acid synthase subunit alpha
MRLLDPEVMEGFDGTNKMQHHTVLLEEDLPPVEVEDMDTAREFKRIHGDPVEIMEDASGTIKVQVKAGAKIYVPRALHTDRWVCAQVPTGWDPKRFDIPDDIVRQVDRVTLYTLVAAAQSLRESGVMDPYEFYEYIHLSQLGNAIGSGIGGVSHLRDMFVNRYHSDASSKG